MKTLGTFIGLIIGFFGASYFSQFNGGYAFICIIACAFIGRAIGAIVDEENQEREERELAKWKQQREIEYENRRIADNLAKACQLLKKYPFATREFFKQHWNISKSAIQTTDISLDKVEKLLSHSEYEYQQLEEKHNNYYKYQRDKEREEERLKEQQREEEIRRQKVITRQKEEEAKRILPNCVFSWSTHSNSTIKHCWFVDYYSYNRYKNEADSSMWDAWHLVWNFKNDVSRISSSDHRIALNRVIQLTENKLHSTFGDKVNYLTLVCLAASTSASTKSRFEVFADRVCSDLGMTNGFDYIRIISDAIPKHLGGNGFPEKSYNRQFFNGKYVILFDDVRTSGKSLELEKSQLESMGAKVIGAITIAQTKMM